MSSYLSTPKGSAIAVLVMTTLPGSRPLISPYPPPSKKKAHVPRPPYRTVHSFLTSLSLVHSSGYVHLDVKPGNVVSNGRDVMLLDFGLSTLRGDLHSHRVGTMNYKPPEIWEPEEGWTGEGVDAWGAGCVVVEVVRNWLRERMESIVEGLLEWERGKRWDVERALEEDWWSDVL
ncbi:hypothetical protein TrRE_jg11770 [Triparma retinervis]|uniref:Cyclin-dependent kinase 2 homolog n=1 Tax=Triparma retinervis TaxID=2557542 RepID=A0A9W7AAB4_9STRA|nr:hypothetical protein TrRE_jg11770 [Triparma retinervis]